MKQILAVEDDKKNQVAIQALLKKNDINITVAGTGMSALGRPADHAVRLRDP